MKAKMAAIAAVVLTLAGTAAYGYTDPSPDSLGYPVYDILMNDIIRAQ